MSMSRRDFIVRLVGERHLLHWNGKRPAAELAETCVMKYRPRVTFLRWLILPIWHRTMPPTVL